MNDLFADVLGSLRAAAAAADDAERSYRASIRQRLEALELERIFAWRRLNLVADMTREAARQEAYATAAGAVIAFVATQFALERGRDRHEAILGRLTPVAEAVAGRTHPPPDGETAVIPDLIAALAAFEAWYLGETGTRFLARADMPMPDTPLTDW